MRRLLLCMFLSEKEEKKLDVTSSLLYTMGICVLKKIMLEDSHIFHSNLMLLLEKMELSERN